MIRYISGGLGWFGLARIGSGKGDETKRIGGLRVKGIKSKTYEGTQVVTGVTG